MPPRELTVRLVEPEKGPPGIASQLTQLLGLSAIFAGLVYSLGWSFAYAWFEIWKMPLAALEISHDQIFEYGRLVLVENWVYIISMATVIATIIWVVMRYAPSVVQAVPFILLAVLIAAWLSCHELGRRTAVENFKSLLAADFIQLPHAEVTLEQGTVLPSRFASALAPGRPCYRLVFMGGDHIWLARTYNDDPDFVVAVLPLEHVIALRLYPSMGNCERTE